MTGILRHTKVTLDMIKFEHTLFALPFALLGALLAAHGWPSGRVLFWILVAMVGARSAAMAFNRLVDRQYDGANPRTKNRALPAGLVSVRFVKVFIVISSAVFFLAAAMLNRMTLLLSPIALASILLYSYAKRVTSYTHLFIGWCLALAPSGAWIAVRGSFSPWAIPLWLSLAVMTWTAGFDIIYSCQDVEFDRQAGLHSFPRKWGIARALWIARGLHSVTFISLFMVVVTAQLYGIGLIGLVLAGGLLIRQHLLVRPDDLSRVNEAFFTLNAYLSVILLATLGGDIVLRSHGIQLDIM
ncbi:MAG: 4-hydroxybenzoate octaprenyltransferase [Acidobacteria bacterium]|nr:MAG: 4-hydroxybenzoate octaprenyltransferase [Acidobacteriota bacterium]